MAAAALFGREILARVFRPEYGERGDIFVRLMIAATVLFIACGMGYVMTAARSLHSQVPLLLTSVTVDFKFVTGGVRILARVRVTGQTGVEMEALTAASIAGLTLIDMTKGIEKGVYLETVRLLEKSGGRSGTWKREPKQ